MTKKKIHGTLFMGTVAFPVLKAVRSVSIHLGRGWKESKIWRDIHQTVSGDLGGGVEVRLWEFVFLCYIYIKCVIIHITCNQNTHTNMRVRAQPGLPYLRTPTPQHWHRAEASTGLLVASSACASGEETTSSWDPKAGAHMYVWAPECASQTALVKRLLFLYSFWGERLHSI